MKIAALIGESASGKSQIGLDLYKHLGKPEKFGGWIFGTLHHEKRVAVLGTYEGSNPFFGTDQIAPQALPHEAGAWLQRFLWEKRDWNVFFEGNTMGSAAFFTYFIPVPLQNLRIYIAKTSQTELLKRHKERGSGKEKNFNELQQNMKKKIAHIERMFPMSCRVLKNETPADIKTNSKTILGYLAEPYL